MKIEQEIIEKCIQGDDRAIAQLYKVLYGLLMSVSSRYQKDRSRAVEITNMGFFNVIKNLSSYTEDKPFEAWVRRIIINKNIDIFRQEKKRREKIKLYKEYRDSSKEVLSYNEAVLMFDADELLVMVRALPPTTQEVFNLFAIDGYSHREVSECLGISEGTSKWHVANARNRLQQMLHDQLKDQNIAI